MQPLELFKALSDDTRLKCVLLLQLHGAACVCDLMTALNLDQPKISRHLASLRRMGLLQDERKGKWVYYQLHPELPAWAKDIVRQACEQARQDIDAELTRLQNSQQLPTCQ